MLLGMEQAIELSASDISKVVDTFVQEAGVKDVQVFTCPLQAFACLEAYYEESVEKLRQAVLSPLKLQVLSQEKEGVYPYLGVWGKALGSSETVKSFGILREKGFHGITVTRPDIFKSYLLQQMESIAMYDQVLFIVAKSSKPIPVYFLKDDILAGVQDVVGIQSLLPLPCLRSIDDEIVDGKMDWHHLPIKPLAYFQAERIDYSLGRIAHYCGTQPQHFQRFIVLTNYHRYTDLFFQYAKQALQDPDSGYTCWVEPQDRVLGPQELSQSLLQESGIHFQMPAYHLVRPDGNGISLVNIGVGPSNARTITDHLAVLRPHCWLMMGHCAGLRHSQVLGDYVLANGYMRQDHVLDNEMPLNVPIPSLLLIHEVLKQAIGDVCGFDEQAMPRRVRMGTVLSVANRNWELSVKAMETLLVLGRAVAVDMETTAIAVNGLRYRVPYAALLCVSDRPFHGELKLERLAKNFYRQRVRQHFDVGIRAMEMLRHIDPDVLHSPELRGFQDVSFR